MDTRLPIKGFHYPAEKLASNLGLQHIGLPDARVLIVDDVEISIEVAKGMMEFYGMQIDCMTSRQEAVDAVRVEKARYNAIFMDHMMPEMDAIVKQLVQGKGE
ncbi:MAG: hypothetical protein LBQ69_05625 [Treponema sp.]|jgi:CheY-like chemotaxis protein|nr:hypothetical protein [Treponema sp.]